MLLRATGENENEYEVVSDCYMYGIMDGESLLGPLPSPYKVRYNTNPGASFYVPTYLNTETNTISSQDPRLGSLPQDWESINLEKTADDPDDFAPHRNNVTGEVINSDPRLLREALEARGVKLQTFMLI